MNPAVYEIAKRTALVGLIILAYFYVLRPARQSYTTNLVAPQVKEWISTGNASADFESKSSKSFYLVFNIGGIQKKIMYSPQAGFFLLLAAIGLIFITFKWQYYVFLLILHLIFEILVILNLWIGVMYSSIGFLMLDFIISYLSPIVSLGLVPLLLVYRNNNIFLTENF